MVMPFVSEEALTGQLSVVEKYEPVSGGVPL
jgi:hypothetical protein